MAGTSDSEIRVSQKKEDRSILRMITLSMFLLATAVGVWLAVMRTATGVNTPLLEVDPRALDIGEVFVNDQFHLMLPVKNVSKKDLEIADIRSSCRCISVNPASLTIPAEGSTNIHLVLDLTAPTPEDTALPLRPFSLRLVPIIKNRLPDAYPQWEVRAIVRTPLVFSPSSPKFREDALVRGSAFSPLGVEVVSNNPLRHLSVACDESLASVSIIPVEEKTGTYRLTISPHEDLELGAHDFRVTFQGVTEDGEEFHGVPLRVSGVVVDDVELLPPMIPVGALTLGQTVTEVVTLRSRTGKAFDVTGWRCEARKVAVESLPEDDASDQKKLRVTLTASELGSQQSVVLFQIRQGSLSDKREVPLRLVYFGTASQSPAEVQRGE